MTQCQMLQKSWCNEASEFCWQIALPLQHLRLCYICYSLTSWKNARLTKMLAASFFLVRYCTTYILRNGNAQVQGPGQYCRLVFVEILIDLTNTVSEAKILITLLIVKQVSLSLYMAVQKRWFFPILCMSIVHGHPLVSFIIENCNISQY